MGALLVFLVLFLDRWPGSNTKISSSSKNLDQDLAKIFDEILLQVFSTSPDVGAADGVRTAGRALTQRPENGGNYSSLRPGDLQINSLKHYESDTDSDKQEEDLAKIFDEILLQVLSKEPRRAPFVDPRAAGRAITRRHVNENPISEGKNDSSLPSRGVDEASTTGDRGILQGVVVPDTRYGSLRCSQLLQFLQKNILVAAVAAAAILAAAVLLVFLLTTYIRRRRPSRPPANMTYNIFIMNGKAWWQKSQEKNLRKLAEKQPKRNSFV